MANAAQILSVYSVGMNAHIEVLPKSVIYNQRTSTSWNNSVAFWWKSERSPRVFLRSFDLDGAFLVSL